MLRNFETRSKAWDVYKLNLEEYLRLREIKDGGMKENVNKILRKRLNQYQAQSKYVEKFSKQKKNKTETSSHLPSPDKRNLT